MTPNKKLTRRDFLKIAGVAGMGATLAACGTPATTAAPAAATKAPAGPPLKVGVLVPTTGIYAVLGESITEGMKMYFESVGNTAGGRKIELVTDDEGDKPDEALKKARKMVEQDQVDLVAGIVSSGVAAAMRSFFDETQSVLIDRKSVV